MTSPLQKEFDFYLANQAEMVEKYDGKFIVIKDGIVVGEYDDEMTAVTETQKSHTIGTFLVQKVSEGDTEYSQTFHSRVPSTADIDFVAEDMAGAQASGNREARRGRLTHPRQRQGRGRRGGYG